MKEKAREVTKFNERLHKLLDDMAETMYDAPGVGLAAPQVGILKRVAVVDVGEGLVELVNPVIVEKSEETEIGQEGCLSIVNLRAEVRRHKRIKVKAQDRLGQPFELEAEGFFARAIQHEVDHLNGVLILDVAERVFRTDEEEKR